MSDESRAKHDHQSSQYEFPYHHLCSWHGNRVSKSRTLKYAAEYYCYTRAISDRVKDAGCGSVLEVGCGDGALLALLVDVADDVTGIDLDKRAVRFAKAFVDQATVYACDVADLKQSYDCVVLCEVLEHIPNDQVISFLSSCRELIAEGGKIILSVPTVVRPVHVKHYRHYDYALLTEHLNGAGLRGTSEPQYIFRDSFMHSLYLKLMVNRLWAVSSPLLDRAEWALVNNYVRYATPRDGAHLIAVAEPA